MTFFPTQYYDVGVCIADDLLESCPAIVDGQLWPYFGLSTGRREYHIIIVITRKMVPITRRESPLLVFLYLHLEVEVSKHNRNVKEEETEQDLLI